MQFPLSRIIVNDSGLSVHVGGRNRPTKTAQTHPHLFRSFASYKTASIAPPPAAVDWSATIDPAALANILDNGPDPTSPVPPVGDCVEVAVLKLIEAITANAGSPVTFTTSQALAFYSHATGYVLGDASTDRGSDEISVADLLVAGGIDGKGTHQMAGSLTVDATNSTEVMQAVDLFGGALIGGELEDPWTQLTNPDDVWTDSATQDPTEGHGIFLAGYDQLRGARLITWGVPVWMPWPAFGKFAGAANGGNCIVFLSPEIVAKATSKSPTGLAWTDLQSDFAALGGNAT